MLRTHLERLEQPLGSEENIERARSLTPIEEEEFDHDEKGKYCFVPEIIFLSM